MLLNQSSNVNKAIKIRDDLLQRHSSPSSSSFAAPSPPPTVAQEYLAQAKLPATGLGGVATGVGADGKGEPVHVVVDEKKEGWFTGRSFWYAVGTGIKWFGEPPAFFSRHAFPSTLTDKKCTTFCPPGFATIAVLVMEQAGTVKLGPSVNEFESSKDGGKVVKFADVQGVEEAKDELQEIVEFRAFSFLVLEGDGSL